ncbi:hypothetical protein [Clostridium lacusfryxellense]|nr:hypothetical protein [Clostridium lacusfryxellense]MBU3111941.1 hypothetical protein [Clostridium lacusfryxellense]
MSKKIGALSFSDETLDISMLYTDVICFSELELFSISSNSECFDKIYFW